jgi:hypothetical protein
MKNRLLMFLLAFVLTATAPTVLFARQGHSGGHGHGNDRDRAHDRDDDHDRDRDRDHDRDNDSGRPPGWDKGKKTGWGDCDVPPGQVKKYGCHPHSTRVRHHDRDDDDRDRDRHRTTQRNDDQCHQLGTLERRLPGVPCKSTTTATTTQKAPVNPAPPQKKTTSTTTARRSGSKVFDDDGTWRKK